MRIRRAAYCEIPSGGVSQQRDSDGGRRKIKGRSGLRGVLTGRLLVLRRSRATRLILAMRSMLVIRVGRAVFRRPNGRGRSPRRIAASTAMFLPSPFRSVLGACR